MSNQPSKSSDSSEVVKSTSTSLPSNRGVKQAINVLADRVLVSQPSSEGERQSRSGILIPATAQVAKRLTWADVHAVGPNVRAIKVGDKILFDPEERYEVEISGETYLILRERDIHAVAAEHFEGGTGLYL